MKIENIEKAIELKDRLVLREKDLAFIENNRGYLELEITDFRATMGGKRLGVDDRRPCFKEFLNKLELEFKAEIEEIKKQIEEL